MSAIAESPRLYSAHVVASIVEKIPLMQSRLIRLNQNVTKTQQEIDDAEKLHTGRPLMKRFKARFSELLRINPIVSSEINQRHEEALGAYQALCNLLNTNIESLIFFGGNLPGRHRFNSLSYDPVDNRFRVGFTFSAMISNEKGYFDAKGDFDALRYRTTEKGPIMIRIPKTDSLSPVLYVPQGSRIGLWVMGYDGPGAYGKFTRASVWTPESNLQPTPIDPKEFR